MAARYNKVFTPTTVLFSLQKKRTIVDETNFCAKETLDMVLNSKVCMFYLFFF